MRLVAGIGYGLGYDVVHLLGDESYGFNSLAQLQLASGEGGTMLDIFLGGEFHHIGKPVMDTLLACFYPGIGIGYPGIGLCLSHPCSGTVGQLQGIGGLGNGLYPNPPVFQHGKGIGAGGTVAVPNGESYIGGVPGGEAVYIEGIVVLANDQGGEGLGKGGGSEGGGIVAGSVAEPSQGGGAHARGLGLHTEGEGGHAGRNRGEACGHGVVTVGFGEPTQRDGAIVQRLGFIPGGKGGLTARGHGIESYGGTVVIIGLVHVSQG